jgi:hypothetical protein
VGCEGDGSSSKREGGRERGTTSIFLSTNLKFEAFLEGRRNSVDQGRLAKGIIVCILCLLWHDRGLLPFNHELLEKEEKKKIRK